MNVVDRLRRRLRSRRRARARRGGRAPDYLFVVTYGRSGSTLLQGLLNCLPRVLVRGENSLFVLPMYRASAQAMKFRHRHYNHRPRQVQSAFYGLRNLRRTQFRTATRRLVTGYVLGPEPRSAFDVIGFKEVRWHEIEPKETEGFFAFMDAAFPGARYLLNERNSEHVATSGFWRRRDDAEAYEAIDRTREIQEFLRHSRPDRTYDCRYEEITSEDRARSDAALRGIAEFVLGSCDDAVLSRMRDTMAIGFGPKAFQGRQRREAEAAAADEGAAGS